MTTAQVDALASFERYYHAFDLALADADCDEVARLVDERGKALAALVIAFSGTALPDQVRQRVELSESRVRGKIAALHQDLMRQLGESRRRNAASARYAEAMR